MKISTILIFVCILTLDTSAVPAEEHRTPNPEMIGSIPIRRDIDYSYQSIFLKDRRPPRPTSMPATRPSFPEETFYLRGVSYDTTEDYLYKIFIENNNKVTKYNVGDTISDLEYIIQDVNLDGIEYYNSRLDQKIFVKIGKNLLNK